MFQRLQKRWQPRSLHQRFQRHCQHLFPLDKHLTNAEQTYLQQCCFGTLARDLSFSHAPWRGVFVHQVQAQGFDASYVSPRLMMDATQAWDVALATMEPLRRTYLLATIQEISRGGLSWRFDGLGWHVMANATCVHFVIDEIDGLCAKPWPQLRQVVKDSAIPCHDHGVVTLFFHQHRIIAHALIAYPRAETPHALMASSQSGMIEEVFVGGSFPKLNHRLNHLGRHILKRYERWGEEIEAFVFRSADDCTLFFA